jgi:copper homeostasis protein
MSTRALIEVAIESVEDAVAAEAGGADRLELCTALDLGGLTPSLGTYLEIREACRLPVVVMIRPRPGDFVYSDPEVRVMGRDIDLFAQYEPDGFVFGVLLEDGRVDESRCGWLVGLAGRVPCVFHRAFDRTPDPTEALEAVQALGFARVLTSGQESTAFAGAPAIAETVKQADGRIGVVPCGRVRANSVVEVVRLTGCTEVHGSFAESVPEGEGRGYRGYQQRSRTSRAEVQATRAALGELALGLS